MAGLLDWLKGFLGLKGKEPAPPAAASPAKQKKPRPRSGQLGNQTPAQMRELRARKAQEAAGQKGPQSASQDEEYERLSASLGEKWQGMFGAQDGQGDSGGEGRG